MRALRWWFSPFWMLSTDRADRCMLLGPRPSDTIVYSFIDCIDLIDFGRPGCMSIETSINRWFSISHVHWRPRCTRWTVETSIHSDDWLCGSSMCLTSLRTLWKLLFTEWIRCLILINLINFSLTNQITLSRLSIIVCSANEWMRMVMTTMMMMLQMVGSICDLFAFF